MSTNSKIFSLKNIDKKLESVRRSGKKIGFVEGIFDVIHLGHIELMQFAKKYCDILVVGVASDAYAKSSKGPGRPIFNQDIRSKVLAALADTDFILKEKNPPAILESKDSEKYLLKVTEIIKPDVIVASATTDRNPGAKDIRAKLVGAKFIIQKDPRPSRNSSTTQILDLLGKGISKNKKVRIPKSPPPHSKS